MSFDLTVTEILDNIYDSLAPWFGNLAETPNINAFIQGYAESAKYCNALKDFVKQQTRIRTSTGGFLDLAAQDYFGNKLRRRTGENDLSYRRRILSNLLAERVTRTGLYKALLNLTGRPPVMFEPWNGGDTCWLNGGWALNYNCLGGNFQQWAYQGFIIVYRPITNGNFKNALNNPTYSLNDGFILQPKEQPYITDDDILDLIARFKAEGVKIWTYILD